MVADKLRAAVERTIISFGGQRIPITMTFGVAAYAGASLDDCVRRGKNRVVPDAPPAPIASQASR